MTTIPAIYRTWIVDRHSLPRRARVTVTFSAVAVLHLAAVVLLARSWSGNGQVLALGTVLTAYLAGLKHSYDWDHVAAIDNSVRKFVAEGEDPVSVGFAFSLGHSTVVTLAGAAVVAGVGAVHGAFTDGSTVNHLLGLVGMAVSGTYLLLLGLANSLLAARCWRALRTHRATPGTHTHTLGPSGGLVARLLVRPLRHVRRPRDVFVIGFLFGLGFDTATTIGLLVLTVGASLAGVSAWGLLGLPIAFTAAMTLCDSLNGVAMLHLYRSALHSPRRKARFNALLTTLSALSALFISTITLTALVHDLFHLDDPVTSWFAALDLGNAGLVLVGVFAILGLGGLAVSRRTAGHA